jgi:DNA-binding LytR/AlgR family response regulator
MNLRTQIPEFLTEKKFLYWTVLFITVFSFLFMNIYKPFSNTTWFSFNNERQLLSMLFFYIVGVLFLFLSKNILWEIQKKTPFTYLTLAAYILSEILIISVFYVAFTKLASNSQIRIIPIFIKAFICITLIMIIPYTISFLYGTVKGLNRVIQEKESKKHIGPHLINLRDLKGKIKLSLISNSLLYVTSEDNYVKIIYEQSGNVESIMLRTTTKNLEENFGAGLIRCHRSYMVNIIRVKLFNNDRENMYIVLDNEKVNPIPVSRSYREIIEETLTQRN